MCVRVCEYVCVFKYVYQSCDSDIPIIRTRRWWGSYNWDIVHITPFRNSLWLSPYSILLSFQSEQTSTENTQTQNKTKQNIIKENYNYLTKHRNTNLEWVLSRSWGKQWCRLKWQIKRLLSLCIINISSSKNKI